MRSWPPGRDIVGRAFLPLPGTPGRGQGRGLGAREVGTVVLQNASALERTMTPRVARPSPQPSPRSTGERELLLLLLLLLDDLVAVRRVPSRERWDVELV